MFDSPIVMSLSEETEKIKTSVNSSLDSFSGALAQIHEYQYQVKLSRDYWRATFNSIDTGVAILDENSLIKRANRYFLEIVQKPFSSVENQIICDVFCGQKHQCSMPSPCANFCVKEYINIDHKTYKIKFHPLYLNAKLEGCVFLAEDFTEELMRQRKLQEARELYINIFNLVTDPILVINTNSLSIIDVNSSAIEFYQYTRDEFMNLCAIGLSAEPEKTIQYLKARQAVSETRVHRKKSGELVSVVVSASYFTINGDTFCVEIVRTIN
jgi:PAS domain-containing protein